MLLEAVRWAAEAASAHPPGSRHSVAGLGLRQFLQAHACVHISLPIFLAWAMQKHATHANMNRTITAHRHVRTCSYTVSSKDVYAFWQAPNFAPTDSKYFTTSKVSKSLVPLNACMQGNVPTKVNAWWRTNVFERRQNPPSVPPCVPIPVRRRLHTRSQC